ncbi:hypothetical protein GCM10008966_22070 [Rhodovulum strictum]
MKNGTRLIVAGGGLARSVRTELGMRSGGVAGASLIAEAVEAWHAALRIFTEADQYVQWAMTHENLALAT